MQYLLTKQKTPHVYAFCFERLFFACFQKQRKNIRKTCEIVSERFLRKQTPVYDKTKRKKTKNNAKTP